MDANMSNETNQMADTMEEQLQRARDKTMRTYENSLDWIREKPMSAILSAVAVGYIAGTLLRKK